MTGPDEAAAQRPDLDTSRPSIARVYDYWLGGTENFEADRQEAERLLLIYPDLPRLARENRQFVGRAVHWLATDRDIRQFLDIGSGLPTASNTHDVAQAAARDSRVVYADIDPAVVRHGDLLLADGRDVIAIQGNAAEPSAILADSRVSTLIQPSRPCAVILAAVLHFFPIAVARRIITELAQAVAPGSYLVISVGSSGSKLAREYAAGTLHDHSPVEIRTLLTGLELVDPPGLVDARDWMPGTAAAASPQSGGRVLAAVARTPGGSRLPVSSAAVSSGPGTVPPPGRPLHFMPQSSSPEPLTLRRKAASTLWHRVDPGRHTMNPTPDTPADNGATFDPGQAAALLDQATAQARRQLQPTPPWLLATRAVMVLAALGGIWLTVRGQHPYRHPTAVAAPIIIAFVVINFTATVTFARRATAGVSGRSRLRPAEIAILAVAWVAVFAVLPALAAAGVSSAVLWGTYPLTVPLIVVGLAWAAIMATRANWTRCGTGLGVAITGAIGLAAGPAGAWLVAGAGLCAVLLGTAAVTAWQQHR